MMRAAIIILALTGIANAQQMLPLTEWRVQLDSELSRVPMSRDAHAQIIGILQNAERQAQAEKQAKAKVQPPPPKEGQSQ